MGRLSMAAAMLIGIVVAPVLPQQASEGARIFLADIKAIELRRTPAEAEFAKIDNEARKALKVVVASIVSKQATPPSGDKHDYMSQAPYFWRNPSTASGFPYVRRDGERNPEIKQFPDAELLNKMINTVERLSLGYFVTGKDLYAARAGEILRMWFIDPRTKMNPNLEFAQAIPGSNTGRGFGIIESRGLTRVVDSVGMLHGASSWSKSDQAGVELWFSKYLEWMTQSKSGKDERSSKNNHGTYYDLQLASFALFARNRELAKATLEAVKLKRIAVQIEPDGRQPLELERTRSWDYSVMNLDGLVSLAQLGDLGVDLWTFRTADGRSIRKAIEYLAPFALDTKQWPFKQIAPMQLERFFETVRRAGARYKDAEFQKLLDTFPKPAGNGSVQVTKK
jgi:hypothetical protein